MTWMIIYQVVALWLILLVALGILFLSYRKFYQIAKAETTTVSASRPDLAALFETALIQSEFIMLYQPKISVHTGKICGAEALVRWHNPTLGWISPAQFIPLAEQTGFIVPLGQWILRTACEQAKQWHVLGFPQVHVAINLSGLQFRIGDLVEDVAAILAEKQLPPESLEIELTETVFLENTEKNILMLKVLKAMGVSISLDDFGTGYSSLKYLRQFPLDSLKIDKCFIENICIDPEDYSIVKAIVDLAKALRMRTVAEGVETFEQIQYLEDLQVDELQGYYYNRPLTLTEFMAELQHPAYLEKVKNKKG